MDSKTTEYIITLKPDASKENILDVLSRDTSADQSVDSNEVPDRAISITNLQSKPGSQRVFRVDLTEDESKILKNNSTVRDVEPPRPVWSDDWHDAQNLFIRCHYNGLSTSFHGPARDGQSANIQFDNWGLWYHANQNYPWTWSLSGSEQSVTWANTADAGLGVDLIIQEGGIFNFNLPEFNDRWGVTRFNKFQWNTLNNCSHVPTVKYELWDSSYSSH